MIKILFHPFEFFGFKNKKFFRLIFFYEMEEIFLNLIEKEKILTLKVKRKKNEAPGE